VARLLRQQNISPRVHVKRFTGPPHPDRDRQFRHIAQRVRDFAGTGDPRISVDTKKKELIGNFKNAGRRWCRRADEVNAHDFLQDAECRAVPYGVYDPARNRGQMRVGVSGDTPRFAVDSIRRWLRREGRAAYPAARRLLIQADAGGSNSCRARAWKFELQRLADDEQLEITVCHYPTGASKWNPVEHRLFGPISQTWAGYPLRDLPTMLGLMRGTCTQTGLRVRAELTRKRYPTKQKVSNAAMRQLKIKHHRTCPVWNYTIKPRKLDEKNTE
jgi:hypothetical protein